MRSLLLLTLSIAACVATLRLPVDRAQGYQHIANGGFEEGLGGWTASPGSTLGVEGEQAYEGAQSAALTLEAGAEQASVRTAIDGALAADTYALTFYARAEATAVEVSATLTLRAGTETWQSSIAAVDVSAGGWERLQASVPISSAASATLSIHVSATPGARLYVDAVSLDGAAPVTTEPSPSPTPLMPLTGASPTSSATAALATLTATATSTPAALVDVIAPVLRNPGFEDIDAAAARPFAWEKYGGALGVSNDARSGGRAAEFTSDTASTKWLQQAVTVEPGAWYEFAAWVLHDGHSVESASLRVAWYASGDASGSQLSTDDSLERLGAPSPAYRLLSTGPVQAPAEARSARVRVLLAPASSAPGRIRVDDAWFGPAAPPVIAVPTAAVLAAVDAASPATSGAGNTSARPRRGNIAQVVSTNSGTSTLRGELALNEVLYDAAGDGQDADGEWVELYNRSDVPIDITGWTLADGRSSDVLPALVVPARGYAIIAASAAFTSVHPGAAVPMAALGARLGNGLGNDGDVLFLRDAQGRVVDAVSWGGSIAAFDPAVEDVPEGHSIERVTPGGDSDTAGDWTDNHRPTPGGPYVAPAPNGSPASRSGRVDVLEGAPARDFGWVPWAAASVSCAALGAVVAWRAIETARGRTAPP